MNKRGITPTPEKSTLSWQGDVPAEVAPASMTFTRRLSIYNTAAVTFTCANREA
ncbi:hypothetical protein AA23498_3444 [Acetobacter nitrogenifigens DSM 23921 = NBRC 105050]|nr:hypothetical protein AA23498_3444 [Acetobacter nitrogenifigens DSM 23921 = NBRC 105050]